MAEYIVAYTAARCEVRDWCMKNFRTAYTSPTSGWDHGDRIGDRKWRWRMLFAHSEKKVMLHCEQDAAWFLLRWS